MSEGKRVEQRGIEQREQGGSPLRVVGVRQGCELAAKRCQQAHRCLPVGWCGDGGYGPSEKAPIAAARWFCEDVAPGGGDGGLQQGAEREGRFGGWGAQYVAAVEGDRWISRQQHLCAKRFADIGPDDAGAVVAGGFGAEECPPRRALSCVASRAELRAPVGEPAMGVRWKCPQRFAQVIMCPEDVERGSSGWRVAGGIDAASPQARTCDLFAAKRRTQQTALDASATTLRFSGVFGEIAE
jgi:hypothetical protein